MKTGKPFRRPQKIEIKDKKELLKITNLCKQKIVNEKR